MPTPIGIGGIKICCPYKTECYVSEFEMMSDHDTDKLRNQTYDA